jgi:hypothetical protein
MTALGEFPTAPFAADDRKRERFPEKTDLTLIASRAPHLVTTLDHFSEMITQNNALFVRWHLSRIPTPVELRTKYRQISSRRPLPSTGRTPVRLQAVTISRSSPGSRDFNGP